MRAFGTTLLAGVMLVAGLAAIAQAWVVWPRSSATSPLAALFALTWGGICTATAVLAWRRSRFAAPAFLVAIGFLLFPAVFLVPGSRIFLPALVVVTLVAALGSWYLHSVREHTA